MIEDISGLRSGDNWVLNTMVWRADETWLMVGEAILNALESGARIDVLKCRWWWSFEWWESSTEGFIPLNILQKWKANRLRKFYKNIPIGLSPEVREQIDSVRKELFAHPNFYLRNETRYNHAKYWLKYNRESWVLESALFGWASIWNEWSGVGEKQYIDCVVQLQAQWMRDDLASALSGDRKGWNNGMNILTRDNYHNELEDILDSTEDHLRTSISYLGDPEHISKLENQRDSEIFISRESNVNRDRNIHFLYELLRRINKGFRNGYKGQKSLMDVLSYWLDFCKMETEEIPDKLKITLLEQMLHMKSLCGDDFVITGSGNLLETWYSELWIALKRWKNGDVDEMIRQKHEMLDSISCGTSSFMVSKWLYSSSLSQWDELLFSLYRSQVERIAMKLESFFAHKVFTRTVSKNLQRDEDFFTKMFAWEL